MTKKYPCIADYCSATLMYTPQVKRNAKIYQYECRVIKTAESYEIYAIDVERRIWDGNAFSRTTTIESVFEYPKSLGSANFHPTFEHISTDLFESKEKAMAYAAKVLRALYRYEKMLKEREE